MKDAQDQSKRDLNTEAAEHRQKQVKEMIEGEITNAAWDELVDQARKAAEHGEKQYLLLRFPSELCTDDSRAINNPPDPTWPQTLRGEAADIYERWHSVLRPHGFNLAAQVLDFPGGKPGDVGLFLRWGEWERLLLMTFGVSEDPPAHQAFYLIWLLGEHLLGGRWNAPTQLAEA